MRSFLSKVKKGFKGKHPQHITGRTVRVVQSVHSVHVGLLYRLTAYFYRGRPTTAGITVN